MRWEIRTERVMGLASGPAPWQTAWSTVPQLEFTCESPGVLLYSSSSCAMALLSHDALRCKTGIAGVFQKPSRLIFSTVPIRSETHKATWETTRGDHRDHSLANVVTFYNMKRHRLQHLRITTHHFLEQLCCVWLRPSKHWFPGWPTWLEITWLPAYLVSLLVHFCIPALPWCRVAEDAVTQPSCSNVEE